MYKDREREERKVSVKVKRDKSIYLMGIEREKIQSS